MEVDVIILGVHSQLWPSTQNYKFVIYFQYLKQNVKNEVEFLQLNIEGFFRFILSFYVRVARCAYVTQNNNVNFSLYYIKKKVNNNKVNNKVPYKLTLIFDGDDQNFPAFRKYQACNLFTIYLKANYRWNRYFAYI